MAAVNGVKAAKTLGVYAPLESASVAGDADTDGAAAGVLEARRAASATGPAAAEDDEFRQLLLVTLISSIGTILEWFDFACFGYFASTFSHQFFPSDDPVASLAATFAVFAGAFVMRPLGGVFFVSS